MSAIPIVLGNMIVAAMLAYHYYQDEVKGDAQDVRTQILHYV